MKTICKKELAVSIFGTFISCLSIYKNNAETKDSPNKILNLIGKLYANSSYSPNSP